MMQPPYPPKKLETAGAPAGLRLEPLRSAMRSGRSWRGCRAHADRSSCGMQPRHQSQTDDSWTSLPTPLASRTDHGAVARCNRTLRRGRAHAAPFS